MTTTPARAGAALMLSAALASGALAGCAGAGAAATTATNQGGQTGGGSSNSRAHIYDSLEEMVEAADLIVTGTAGAQQVFTDTPGSAMTFTVTTLTVTEVVSPDTTAAAGSTVVVRQITTAPGWTSSEPDAALEEGQDYLLFLVHSSLSGEAAAQYYPVGVVAGIYQADGGAFVRAVPDSGDDLPTTLTPDQLRG